MAKARLNTAFEPLKMSSPVYILTLLLSAFLIAVVLLDLEVSCLRRGDWR
jgi:hypothetical protein